LHVRQLQLIALARSVSSGHDEGMSRGTRTIDPRQIAGVKRLRSLLPLLAPLHDVGCGRDAAGNRQLHFDEYVTLVLLYLMNPMIDSVRSLQKASAVDKLAEQLGVKRFNLGSFSESVRVFDPGKLKAIVLQIAGEHNASLNAVNADPRLKDHLKHPLTIVDGTVLDAITSVAAAAWLPFTDGTVKHAWKLHVQLDFDTFTPTQLELTDARNTGHSDEKNVLRKKLRGDCCYVMDRWYGQFTLFNEIHAKAGSYVCRVKENSVFEVVEERAVSHEAREAGVFRDAVVTMGLHSPGNARPNHPMRLVLVEAEPHAKRGGRGGKTAGPGNKGKVVIATDLLDVPAQIIALIYQHRWAIEVFFRFFKQMLGCRHLISQKPDGILIQVYCAVIACMLINLWTGKRPNKRTLEMLAWYFMGVASTAEVMAHLNQKDNTGVKLAAKEALWKKLGY
jgi:hypothetical protein